MVKSVKRRPRIERAGQLSGMPITILFSARKRRLLKSRSGNNFGIALYCGLRLRLRLKHPRDDKVDTNYKLGEFHDQCESIFEATVLGARGMLSRSNRSTDRVVLLEVEADSLFLENRDQFKKEFLEISLDGVNRVVLDLSKVTHLDSSGLSVLLSCQKRATQANATMSLAAVGDSLRSVLEMVRMDRIFDLHPTVESALKSESTITKEEH